MACSKTELREWLDRIPETDGIGVDEGGLTLVSDSGFTLEIGGIPEDADESDECIQIEPLEEFQDVYLKPFLSVSSLDRFVRQAAGPVTVVLDDSVVTAAPGWYRGPVPTTVEEADEILKENR